jgi:hypothetical protein
MKMLFASASGCFSPASDGLRPQCRSEEVFVLGFGALVPWWFNRIFFVL